MANKSENAVGDTIYISTTVDTAASSTANTAALTTIISTTTANTISASIANGGKARRRRLQLKKCQVLLFI